MKRIFYSSLLLFALVTTQTTGQTRKATTADSIRIDELNRYWKEVSRSVREGDFEGYKATYHKDAVCVFTTGKNKRSASIETQLGLWKKDFVDTKSGKTKNNVEFRFTQRVGDSTTAHETGIFYFTSVDKEGKILSQGAVHFEGLLVKRNGSWLAMMEYQKVKATQEEWDALK
jgi:ketosteroid isomerase-like protein